ncbi:Heat shock protein DnaJ [Yasminevirus sp. GU-2018]|uniref:Heat shock protein DnaJ n=1 Tax=Yasminevirus sp. GU-2018 TaxID=2420051 RepID=A0A5K0UB22_9VIRU|nr:Heat shock protein DnaJ [Yasminevirus sp. GU-2018]
MKDKKVRCVDCDGSGFTESVPVRCSSCEKHKIYGCSGCVGGYTRHCYVTCQNCSGAGEISKDNQLNYFLIHS